jgi:hypothetical protein
MAGSRRLNRIVLAILIAGAVVFVLMLAGVGSGALTNPVVPVTP